MSGRAALEALVASPDALGVSPAHAAELSTGVRGVLRSTAGADGGDAETVRKRRSARSTREILMVVNSSFFICSLLTSCLSSSPLRNRMRGVDVASWRAHGERKESCKNEEGEEVVDAFLPFVNSPPKPLADLDNLHRKPKPKPQLWRLVSKTVLSPSHPFHAHRLLHEACYAGWDPSARGPAPLWSPDRASEGFRETNLAKLMATLSDVESGKQAAFSGGKTPLLSREWDARATGCPLRDYDLLHRVSVSEPEFFWPRVLAPGMMRVDFETRPSAALGRVGGAFSSSSPSAYPSSSSNNDDDDDPDSVVWLPGARINAAAAALSPRARDDDAPALVAAGEAEPTRTRTVRRRELRLAAGTAAAAFLSSGLGPGDRVAVVGPLTPALVAVYLGAVLAGLVPVAVAESFSAAEVATRLRLSGARGVWAADAVTRGGKTLPLLPRILEAAASAAGAAVRKEKEKEDNLSSSSSSSSPLSPFRVFVGSSSSLGVFGPLCGGGGGDCSSAEEEELHPSAAEAARRHADDPGLLVRRWAEVVASLEPGAGLALVPFVAAAPASLSPMTLLFSSGTTGEPKAIPWSHVTPLRCAVDCFANLDLRAGDVLCWPTSLGWMMGAFSVFGALLNGACLALFDGAPLGRGFGEFVAAARVTQLGVVPSMVRAWRAAGWLEEEEGNGNGNGNGNGKAKSSSTTIPDWGSLRVMASTGEASAPEDYAWLSSRARYVPVLEFCGGTEVGSAYASGTLLQDWSPSTFTTPTLGCSFVLLVSSSPSSSSPSSPGGDKEDDISDDNDLHAARQSPHGSTEPCSGELALVPPILGSSQALFVLGDAVEGRRRHRKTYYEGMPRLFHSSRNTLLRRHGDAFARLPGGGGGASCYAALGRTDDAMNLGGVKVASAEVERVVVAALGAKSSPSSPSSFSFPSATSSSSPSPPPSSAALPLISEVAAVGVPAPGGGPDSLVLVVVPATSSGGGAGSGGAAGGGGGEGGGGTSSSSSSSLESALRSAAAAAIRRDLSPLFRVERVVLRSSLPRTATGKIMRRTLRDELKVGAKL